MLAKQPCGANLTKRRSREIISIAGLTGDLPSYHLPRQKGGNLGRPILATARTPTSGTVGVLTGYLARAFSDESDHQRWQAGCLYTIAVRAGDHRRASRP